MDGDSESPNRMEEAPSWHQQKEHRLDALDSEAPSSLPGTNSAPPKQRGGVKVETRKKPGVVPKKWLKFDKNGDSAVVKADKQALMSQLGLQARDLRLLDPALTPLSSAVLCREKSLVVSLEHIKAICTPDYMLVFNPEDKEVIPFVEHLRDVLAAPALDVLAVPPPGAAGRALPHAQDASVKHSSSAPDLKHSNSAPDLKSLARESGSSQFSDDSAEMMTRKQKQREAQSTPFELRALEVVLDYAAGRMERLTADLEDVAKPALNALTRKIDSRNLQRVRTIKNRLARLSTRVKEVRGMLEGILDDDGDMRDMNLTAKRRWEAEGLTRKMSMNEQGRKQLLRDAPQSLQPTLTLDLEEEHDDVEEVEMVLEPSFLRIDNTFNKLSTLTEDIHDTEDYINIELDSKQNELIKVNLLLSCTTFALGIITALTALFAMNLGNAVWSGESSSYWAFVLISVGSSVLCMAVMVPMIIYLRRK